MSSQPFAGITVIEFGQFIAVPYCAQMLADGGANVIKVESLEGDPVRHLAPIIPGESRHFIARNRGKRCLPLDLRNPASRPVIDALLASADVVLTNLRPGLAGALGLDYAAISARFPRAIVGNVTAFGREGADAGLAGMDIVVQARSGLMAANGRIKDGLPYAGDPPIADHMAAAILAFGVASALLRRATTGHGGEVEVSLLASAMALENNFVLRVDSVDGPIYESSLKQIARARAEGRPYTEQLELLPGTRTTAMATVYYRTYATRDSALVIACGSPSLRRAFMRAVEMEDPFLANAPDDQARIDAHYADFAPLVEAQMATRTTAEWRVAMDREGVPASGVRFPIELLDDEQTLLNGMVYDMPHPGLNTTVRRLSTPLTLDGDGFHPGPTPNPFGADTRNVLASLGFSHEAADALIAAGVTFDT